MTDLTLQTLIEFRGEVREFRDETRKTLAEHGHRLNLLTEQGRHQSGRLSQLEDFRAEVRDFRDETRKTLAEHGHRLNSVTEQMRDHSARLAQLETHMAALLATMPHVRTRIDDLAARVAILEEKLASRS